MKQLKSLVKTKIIYGHGWGVSGGLPLE